MSDKHSPGPWTFSDSVIDRAILSAKKAIVCDWDLRGRSGPPKQADAILMAAAPELLSALEDLYDEQNGPPLFKYEKSWKASMEQASAAIDKARGCKVTSVPDE